MLIILIVLAVLGAGAAAFFLWIKPKWINRIDVGPGTTALSKIAVNIGAGDLLDPSTAASRLTIYLDELIGLGYSREIRCIFTPGLGSIIYEHWWPVLRAKGFKVLAILAQGKTDSADIAEASEAWARQILPLVKRISVFTIPFDPGNPFKNIFVDRFAFERFSVSILLP